jgi:hypothetical protein
MPVAVMPDAPDLSITNMTSVAGGFEEFLHIELSSLSLNSLMAADSLYRRSFSIVHRCEEHRTKLLNE